VHATGQVISFCCPVERLRVRGEDEAEALRRFMLGCNGLLSEDVRLLRVERAPLGPRLFSARFSALGKTYVYRVDAGEVAHPLRRRDHLHAHLALDLEKIRQAAQLLVGEHDFGGFANTATQPRDPVRLITRVHVSAEDAEQGSRLLKLEFTGSGFLFRQVRNMTGALLRVGSGRMSAEEVAQCLATGKRPAAIKAVPAHGLCLADVLYPDREGIDPALVAWAAAREAAWKAAGASTDEEEE
jgi:tRNA pseudouridine38-40 synthase